VGKWKGVDWEPLNTYLKQQEKEKTDLNPVTSSVEKKWVGIETLQAGR